MSKTLEFQKFFAERAKAKDFTRKYVKEHGSFPSVELINEAKALTPEEEAKIELDAEIGAVISRSGSEEPASWDYIWNEETWNASYENGVLKDYYIWADGASPYKEDLWNTVENRPANWNDIEKDEQGNPIEYEDGYHYANCVRCWLGAINAPGAAYPWCAARISSFEGIIRWDYNDSQTAFPWGTTSRKFNRTFAIASVPRELGEEYKLDSEGHTTFEPEKLTVTLVFA